MSGQSTPARGTPPKRLTLTPGPRPLHLGTGSFALASPSKVTSPLATPPTTAPLPPRRMGSVSYQVRDDFQLGERPEGASGLTRGGSLREFGGRRGRGHGASASVATGDRSLEQAQQEALERKRRSASALDDQPPPALTLAEKHKDLLHFIAQKESKCVELRAQLAAHEADLLQLKKKWEKIVAKGNDRQARSASGAVDLVRGIFGGLGELAIPSSSANTPPTPSHSSSSSSTPGFGSSPVLSTSPFKNAKPSLTTTASRAASKGHLMHTPHSSSSSNSTGISSGNTTRLSLSSASSLGGAELLKEKETPEGDDDDPDAWGPFETAHTEEPEPISAGSALGLSGVEVQSPKLPSAVAKIPGAESLTKSTKRASTLLSDVSSAWTTTLNALAPPPAPSLTKPTGGSVLPRPSPTIRLTTSKSTSSPSSKPTPTRSATLKTTTSKPSKPSPAPISTSTRPVSLLDDDDGAGDSLGAVLQPSPSASVRTKMSDAASIKTESDAFGNDWNW